MNDLRCRPQDLCISDAMPWQQHHECRTVHQLADVIHDRFFLTVASNIRAGDQITICRYAGIPGNHNDAVLAEVATVRVIQKTKDAIRLLLTGHIEVPKPEAVPEIGKPVVRSQYITGSGRVEWKGPQKKWTVYVGDSEIIDRLDDKDQAGAIARGDAPIPERTAAA